ncbi:GH92 family glycosyl hydrolase [Streptomyces sp. CA-111067]|uniref:GH92 family glycosyl hydrolase n=1 Tax=Streptomyces sp. CA-111067 TaxID=3240046 RepID=UPI003D971B3E
MSLLGAGLLFGAGPAVSVARAADGPAPVTEPAAHVDPMIGTGVGGSFVGPVDTFPGPDAPFGMIQWGPDTGPGGPSKTAAGYYHDDTTINGFSLARLSGVGCNIFQDFEFLPTNKQVTGSPGTDWASYTSAFSHDTETAKPGYYGVTLADSGIRTELTASARTAQGRFTYPAGGPATLLLNTSHGYGNSTSSLQVAGPRTLVGTADGGHFCGHPTQLYTVHFAVTFDHPFTSYGTWQGGTATPGAASVSGAHSGGWVSFDPAGSPVVNAKVAISYVSVDGAKKNLAADHAGFDATRASTYQAWNSLLGKVEVGGGTGDQQTTFYTALYHSLLDPSLFNDVDGRYEGFDGKVHRVAPGRSQYTNFSGWDTYRSQVPLTALIAPQQTSDMMQSLVNDAEQGGWLPKWPTANVYTAMMGGDSADPIIATAYAYGARDFDVKSALRYMVKGADDTTSAPGQGWFNPRTSTYVQPGAADTYVKKGYVPTSADSSAVGTSLTQEYALDDFSIARFAAAIDDSRTSERFTPRAQNWQNVFDPATGYTQPRGGFSSGDAAVKQTGFEEGNAAQYTWMVPQNIAGLSAAMGGDSATAAKLDAFFSQLNAGPDAPDEWAGNEVTFGAPWTYDYLGQPWKTQKVVRDIATQLYSTAPGGEPGNDDLGAQSSWYVWAALGLYPQTSGVPQLVTASPLFPKATLALPRGRELTVKAPNAAADAPYVHALSLNGRSWNNTWLPASVISGGGSLDFTLSGSPDTSWGTGRGAAPQSFTAGEAPAIGFAAPSGGLVANRGQSRTLTVGARSETARPATVKWSATAPDGITVTPSSGVLKLGPGGQATQPVTVTVGSGTTDGDHLIHYEFTDPRGHRVSSADQDVSLAPPLAASFDNSGTTDDADPTAGAFGDSGKTYSAQALASVGITPGGTVAYDGTTFTWPKSAPGTPDNVEADGQVVSVSGPSTGAATRLAFLGSSFSGTHGGTGTIFYTDGSTQDFPLSFSDWWTAAAGDHVVATAPYINAPTGRYDHPANLYYASVPLAAGRTVAAVTLPPTGDSSPAPGMHIFAVAVS